jgi:hypothetical protein
MPDYTIRYLRRDGAVSMYYRPSCFSDADAARQAKKQMSPEFACAEVWKDLECLEILTVLMPGAQRPGDPATAPSKAA